MTWVDLILKTESKPDQTIRVMKFVLDLSSPVFLAAFKENNFSNGASLEYVITGYSETVVKSAIRRLKVLEFVRRRQQDWKLNAEEDEDEMSYQLIRRDAGALGQAVGYVQEAWPDSSDDLEHSGASGP